MMKQKERRKYPRFQVEDVAVAILGKTKVGIITDISKGGLAFRYIGFDQEDEEHVTGSLEVKTFSDVADFYLLDIPYAITRKHTMPSEYYLSTLCMKKCCLQFGGLNPKQITQLEYFIDLFANPAPNLELNNERL
jgi:hypothetical protein